MDYHRFNIIYFIIMLMVANGMYGQSQKISIPHTQREFHGKLEPTEQHSIPYLTVMPVEAPKNAPNIVLILTDDIGFGAVSTFGGPIPTPNLDKIASRGLRYNQFHTTGICSASRAALITGRNHHSVGTGALTEMTSAYPGYTGVIPRSAATIGRVLRDNGCNTAWFGKTHNVPTSERSSMGPFDLWPSGMGFQYFYGFISGDMDQYTPTLFENNVPVDGSTRPDNYLLDEDLINHTIQWIHNQKAANPDKPFFIYEAFGTAHAPQQVHLDWIDKFEGKFDEGCDKEREKTLSRQIQQGIVPKGTQLAPRPAQIPAWNSLSQNERTVFSRLMETYAGVIAHQDFQYGRLFDELDRMGELDNTLIVFIEGDNGSAGETGVYGSLNEIIDITTDRPDGVNYDVDYMVEHLDEIGMPGTYNAIPVGWSFAMDCPFTWVKQVASHLGAVSNGMVISWPSEISNYGIRNQYSHVIDIAPTLYEIPGITPPDYVDGVEQKSIEGTSIAYSFKESHAASRHKIQYYEIIGNRGIYSNGWLANTTPQTVHWHMTSVGAGTDVNAYPWELYNLNEDFSQSNNLANHNPEKLKNLQQLFDQEARKYHVYPIMNSSPMVRIMNYSKLQPQSFRTEYTYWGGDISIPNESGPYITSFPFTLEAHIEVDGSGGNGVIYANGSRFGGWSFYLDHGIPVCYASSIPLPGAYRVKAKEKLRAGKHVLKYQINYTEKGANILVSVDEVQAISQEILGRPSGIAGGGEMSQTGRDSGVAVSPDYKQEGVFEGIIDKVIITLQTPEQLNSKSLKN
ncbi:MAG TPA: arylsulfatase [Saprospiraceae bacterium]|nr:arylsulfatase [Saprospiraceae bacterium]